MSGAARRETLRIEGMHCSSCALAIDMELEDVPGVEEALTTFARATTEVAFDPARVDLSTIIATVRKAGYEARAVG